MCKIDVIVDASDLVRPCYPPANSRRTSRIVAADSCLATAAHSAVMKLSVLYYQPMISTISSGPAYRDTDHSTVSSLNRHSAESS
jgi:hypothetical protein